MSNYDLKSRVNDLERELNQQQQINRELRDELSTIIHGVSRADQELTDSNNMIRNTLDNCNSMMNSSHERVIAAYEMQGEIERLYVRFKNMETANKNIRVCNNKKYYEFNNYRTVRKIVQGVMDNIDLKMVNESAIAKSIEKSHLQVPDYWLTCVLISIMAWKNDDKELADRAMERAIGLDKKNSSIFYMIFNLRMARESTALKWFNVYQECELKGSDQQTFILLFSLVSKTISENVDDETRDHINRFINKVVLDNAKAEGYSEDELATMICGHFRRMSPHDTLDYPALRKYCTEFGYMSDVMMSAKTNISILEFILSTTNVTVGQKNEYLKGYIDDLIARPNQVEKGVYDEIAYNEMIISFQGDVEAARGKYDQEQKRAVNQLNLISEMINWIYTGDSNDINGQVRLNMFTITRDLQKKAVKRYYEEYRSRVRSKFPVSINEYSTEVDFKAEEEEKQKVSDFFTEKRNQLLAGIKDMPAYISFGAAAAAIAGAFFAGYWMLFLSLIGISIGVGKILVNKSKRKQLEFKCQDETRSTVEILQKIFEDYKAYTAEFSGYDALSERIDNELNKL